MNPFEMVVAIVAITGIASVLRAKYGVVRTGRGRNAREEFIGRDDPDKERMRAELQTLKERVAVLERLATDDTTSLEREIERLRDKA
jgi:hypothetical protein